MSDCTVIVPDLHGHAHKFAAVRRAFAGRGAHFVFLGDLIDRGVHGWRVVEGVRALHDAGRATVLCGNHEAMAVGAMMFGVRTLTAAWLGDGGLATLRGYRYGCPGGEAQLERDLAWLAQSCVMGALLPGGILASHASRRDVWPLLARAPGIVPGDSELACLWEVPRAPLPSVPGVTLSVHGHVAGADAQVIDDVAAPAVLLDCAGLYTVHVLVLEPGRAPRVASVTTTDGTVVWRELAALPRAS